MEFNDNKPIYLQLADQIMDDLEHGWKRDGDRLPSVREYAANSGVNANTVMRTYTWLQQEDVIYNQRGIGYFFCNDATKKVFDMRYKYFMDKEIDYFFGRLKVFGISPESLQNMYQKYINASTSVNDEK